MSLDSTAAHLGLVLTLLAGMPLEGHGQASMASALAGASLVPALGGERGASVGVAAGGASGWRGGPTAGGGTTSFTTAEAADFVRSQLGGGAVVILYGTNCPRSQAMFPGFVALATRHAGRQVAFLAFAVDRQAQDVAPFLARYGAPFQPFYIKRWPPGQMSRDMATLGLQIPTRWSMPHVAVLDASGRVIAEWDAATDLGAIDAALSSLP
jgi:hypothetical protein